MEEKTKEQLEQELLLLKKERDEASQKLASAIEALTGASEADILDCAKAVQTAKSALTDNESAIADTESAIAEITLRESITASENFADIAAKFSDIEEAVLLDIIVAWQRLTAKAASAAARDESFIDAAIRTLKVLAAADDESAKMGFTVKDIIASLREEGADLPSLRAATPQNTLAAQLGRELAKGADSRVKKVVDGRWLAK